MAAFDPVTAALELGGKLLDRFFPDPVKAGEAKLELAKMAANGELAKLTAETAIATAQAATNTEEAKSANLFVAGWRPFIGWVCGSGLAFQFIIAPIATWATMLYGKTVAFPSLDMGTLITLLAGMLGLGAMRTTEKITKLKNG
jgi:hypothetical protein